jgi:hypothetical protein
LQQQCSCINVNVAQLHLPLQHAFGIEACHESAQLSTSTAKVFAIAGCYGKDFGG